MDAIQPWRPFTNCEMDAKTLGKHFSTVKWAPKPLASIYKLLNERQNSWQAFTK